MFNSEQLRKNFWNPEVSQTDLLPKIQKDEEDQSKAMITTGPSMLGIRFDRGVIFASNTLVAYFTLHRYQNIQRIFRMSDNILFTGSGDFPDIQAIKRHIDSKIIDEEYHKNCKVSPRALSTWLTRVLYYRRSKMDPYYVTLGVGGMDEDNTPFLATIDKRGCCYEDFVVATGFAAHMAMPLVRERRPSYRDLTAREAAELVRTSMEVLFYRDTLAMGRYAVGICTENYCEIKGPFNVSESWSLAINIEGY
ncbi:proteasome subunit beta type-4-like [Drosophila tropicalis]|uniref:proteasome subunit beta type-4-like n=1 Tax=Drosophila tropicalis TaxID=46794 RepID=UPI0035ABE98D